MTVFSPTLIIALLNAGAFMLGGAQDAGGAGNAPVGAEPPAKSAPQVPEASVKAPPREVKQPEKVELDEERSPALIPVRAEPQDAVPAAPAPAPEAGTPEVETPEAGISDTETGGAEIGEAEAGDIIERIATEPVGLTNDEVVERAKTALEAVSSATGRFRQIDPDGNIATGSYAIQRPGRLRFDYDDPTPILIVADGSTLAMRDDELDSVERVPLISTPLGVIAGKKADFDERAKVIRVRQGNGRAAVTVVDPNGEYDGELTLTFETEGWNLLNWLTVDAFGGVTVVELSDTKTNVKIDPRLFRLEEERDSRDRDDRR